MGTAIKRFVPDRVKPPFVTLTLRAERRSARMSNITNDEDWHMMLYSCSRMATVGVRGLTELTLILLDVRMCVVSGRGNRIRL